jgi:DNA helicase-2/ATP-dependent DNA helicase PcrA
MLFGTLVHETIEDIHKAALRGEENLINAENIEGWFNTNYNQLSHSEHAYLAPAQIKAALKQIQNYAKHQNGDWSHIREAEVDVSLVKPNYILEGTIDLIRGTDDTVEIVDFKTAKKPDVNTANGYEKWQLEQYRRQLNIYAYLVEQKTGLKVSKVHLYYTSAEDGNPQITWDNSRTAIDATMQVFNQTAHNILTKKYDTLARSQRTCDDCDLRYLCGRVN